MEVFGATLGSFTNAGRDVCDSILYIVESSNLQLVGVLLETHSID
jgi:hypothetical protein